MPGQWIEYQSQAGQAIPYGEQELVPITRWLRLKLPGLPGGLIWNRPAAVVVREPDGSQRVLPVRDLTRLIQVALLGLGLGAAALWLQAGKKRAD